MPELFDLYYRVTTVAEAQNLGRGQLCWGPGLYLPKQLATLQLLSYDPRGEQNNIYAISPNQSLEQAFNHTPVH